MKITPKKVRKLLLVVAAVAVVCYAWEYYCVTRPIGECGSLCENRSVVLGYYGDKPFMGNMCQTWYAKFWK